MEHPQKSQEGLLTLDFEVREAERTYRRRRREAAGSTQREEAGVGLALSGGGIRSATFGLGVLQGLAEARLFRDIDYLSTVSGGGYIGACLSSLLSRFGVVKELEGCAGRKGEDRHLKPGKPAGAAGNAAENPYLWPQTPGNQQDRLGKDFPLLKRSQIHHLRSHGNFLITRSGAFTREIFCALGHAVIGTCYTLAFFLTVLLAVTAVYILLTCRLGGAKIWDTVNAPWSSWGEAFDSWIPLPSGPYVAILGAGFVVGLACAYWVARPLGRSRQERPGEETLDVSTERSRLQCFAYVAAVALVAMATLIREAGFGLLGAGWPEALRLGGRGENRAALLLPAAFSLGMLAAIGVSYSWMALSSMRWGRSARTLHGGMFGIGLYFFGGGLVFALVPLVVWYLQSLDIVTAIGTLIAFITSRFLIPSAAGVEKQRGAVSAGTVRSVALQIVVPLAILGGLILACRFFAAWGLAEIGGRWAGFLAADLIFFLLLSFLCNFNRVSPHYFYRDRLSEAYLRTDDRCPGKDRQVTVRDDGTMELRDLHGRKEDGAEADNPAPYHLIVCAVNLAGSHDLTRRTRKSDVFTFSRLYCGSVTTSFVRTSLYCKGETELARVMTISGAAASPAMGVYTSFATSFAMALFNVRLGYWMPNPGRCGDGSKKEARASGAAGKKKRAGKGTGERRLRFWPGLLYREMFGETNAKGRMVNLSDGGHTGDNLGIYPLLQRRCRLIIACDASWDPDSSFKELSEAIRMIDVDENVKVRIDLDDLRARGEEKLAGSHYAVGRIDYPKAAAPISAGEAGHPAADPDSRGGEGWLLYLRPSLTGDEPAPVFSYRAGNPQFPHQTTADQFYDDDQFESYRALGQHITDFLFGPDGKVPGAGGADAVAAWCQKEWSGQNPSEG